ncbi:MAG: hypothetical protein KZQ64_04375 [gamma proteobacterium symbiont of Bathyaustriella thionipta]|nr:hypothetical protein [gamma proteobacterium symbiont of Bathyaustriella thionipta]MCU7948679.1 hypothetical protein [gamma proteobacterium symbiont of Bathyaustriella thionipta]MCU7952615.1 hypothetical protein [gamma proteobacterium symbiont of Bathyaustriella thionipta]MCU7967731.1 hypothetical protein [gamma proteobacterium symbiont of Bathyaustriella thionipta]
MPDENITLRALQKVTYKMALPVRINCDDSYLQCNELLRIVPAKRLVFSGAYFNEKVIIKLFVHSTKAEKHWQRECNGAKLLSDNKILTPEIIAQGVSDEGLYYLVFPFIEGQNLAQFWQENHQKKRVQKLKQLIAVLEKHHSAGLAHQDLHYANFLLADSINSGEQTVYTLDGEEVKAHSNALDKTRRLRNLALFLAQTFEITKSLSASLLNDYIALTSLRLKHQEAEQFWQWIKDYQQQRIDHYLKKVVRECTDVIYTKIVADNKKQGYTLCRREYHSPAIQQLLDQPEQFFQDENAVYLKQGNTCTVKSVVIDNERYVVKRYNPKGRLYELTHKGQISRARQSWLNAHLLRFMGILTPEPVALIEQQPALGQRCSYFICKFQQGQSSWDYFCEQPLTAESQKTADELIAVLKRLGHYQITHGDLKGSNFLIEQTHVYLLDLDAMSQHKFNWQFTNNWQRDKQRFLKNWDKKSCYKPWKAYFGSLIKI